MGEYSYKTIRDKYLEYFHKNGHAIIPSASLVPENDPTVLFVNAGMFPLVPFLLGEKHPAGTRLVDSQRCVRTIDIDSVGDNTHCTTFEMLGNWSLNDYFKKEAINFTLSFFVDELGVDINRIYGSAFAGDEDAPKDEESVQIWKEIFKKRGIEAKEGDRIQLYGKDKNWWELAGGGPCGPCSEIFYDTGKPKCGDSCHINCDCGKYVELGNNVLMEYLKTPEGYKPLGRHNVDFGGGLDRLAMILQNKESVFETDIYQPIFKKVEEIAEKTDIKSERIIVDHIKAATWMIMDGVVPGRTEREYILRRIIRRAVRHGKKIGITTSFTKQIAEIAIKQFSPIWLDLETKKEEILKTLEDEEEKFNKTLQSGLKEVEKITKSYDSTKQFINENGESFRIYETYGFPPEMLIEELANAGIIVDEEMFWKNHTSAFETHQEKSRSATQGLFKGGLADTSEGSTKLHTATHLLLKALYLTLGSHIYQKGSNITPERLRLDFPNDTKLTEEQVKEIEDIVNTQIEKKLDVTIEETKKEEALKLVPYAAFEEKYGDIVKVYYIGPKENPFSIEICNGPHVKNTGELGHFKITKQENVGAGVKRIKAILE